MAVTIKNIIPRKTVALGSETQYTANNCTTVIDKFTISNVTAVTDGIVVYLVASGGSPGNNNTVIPIKFIQGYEVYTCPELVGQVLLTGDFISTNALAGSTFTISASGREIT